MTDVLVGPVVPESMTDFPGLSASVLYLGGCNFRCRFCNNFSQWDPELCEKRDCRDVAEKVSEAAGLVKGVVITGGEPTAQPQALMELCHLFSQLGLKVKVDTNGSNAGIIAELLERNLVDTVALDVKAPSEKPLEWQRITGAKPEKPFAEITRLMRLKGAFRFTLECRTTVVPGIVSRPHEIELIAKEVAAHADRYVLQQFRPGNCLDPAFDKELPQSPDGLMRLAAVAKKYVKDVRIRTAEEGEDKA